MPSTVPVISRRCLLAGGAALAALGLLATGCGAPPPPPRVDDLKAQSDLARRDSDMAAAAAAEAAAAPMAAALKEVAAERARHAVALDTEVARVAGSSTTASSTSSATSPTTSAVVAPPPSVTDVVNALRDSAESARQVTLTSSDYRAGLLASIAASCTAAVTVALAPGQPTP